MSSSTHARHLFTLLLLSYQCTSEFKKNWFCAFIALSQYTAEIENLFSISE